MIELLLEVAQGRGTAFLDIVQNRTHQIGGFGSAHCSTRHRGEQFGTGQVLTTQVNDLHDVLTHNAPSYQRAGPKRRGTPMFTRIVRLSCVMWIRDAGY